MKPVRWRCCGLTLAAKYCPTCGRKQRDQETTVKRARVGEP